MLVLKLKKRNVPLGEGVTLVRDMFVAESMEEAKEKAGEHIVNYMRWVLSLERFRKSYESWRRVTSDQR